MVHKPYLSRIDRRTHQGVGLIGRTFADDARFCETPITSRSERCACIDIDLKRLFLPSFRQGIRHSLRVPCARESAEPDCHAILYPGGCLFSANHPFVQSRQFDSFQSLIHRHPLPFICLGYYPYTLEYTPFNPFRFSAARKLPSFLGKKIHLAVTK